MDYKIKFRSRPEYLLAYVRAPKMTVEVSLAFMQDIHEKCKGSDARKLMVVRDIPDVLNTIDFFNVSKDSVELLKGVRTAWINPYPGLRPALEFAITVANNRGASYALFPDAKQAEPWLAGKARKLVLPNSFATWVL